MPSTQTLCSRAKKAQKPALLSIISGPFAKPEFSSPWFYRAQIVRCYKASKVVHHLYLFIFFLYFWPLQYAFESECSIIIIYTVSLIRYYEFFPGLCSPLHASFAECSITFNFWQISQSLEQFFFILLFLNVQES